MRPLDLSIGWSTRTARAVARSAAAAGRGSVGLLRSPSYLASSTASKPIILGLSLIASGLCCTLTGVASSPSLVLAAWSANGFFQSWVYSQVAYCNGYAYGYCAVMVTATATLSSRVASTRRSVTVAVTVAVRVTASSGAELDLLVGRSFACSSTQLTPPRPRQFLALLSPWLPRERRGALMGVWNSCCA